MSLGNLEPWHDRFSGLEGRQVPPFSDLQLVSEQLGFGTSLVLYDMFELPHGGAGAPPATVLP